MFGGQGERWSLQALSASGKCWSRAALSKSVCIGSMPGSTWALLGVL